ncbi:MAG: ABC-F family ATP-binding cassette domain-containing protein, partial [Flavobacteriales bacterium]
KKAMVTVGNLTIHFGSRELFSKVGFFVGPRERIGLTGKNGAGKSTLLKVLAGEVKPNQGSVAFQKGTTIGYLPQEMIHAENQTVYEEAGSAFKEIGKLKVRLEELNDAIVNHSDYTSDDYAHKIEELSEISHRLEILGGDNTGEKIEKVLRGLGFLTSDMHRKMHEFSGGWKMRVELGKILLQNPDILLLDEPTNHLDIESIQWLEEFLQEHAGAVLLISHDRAFLDNVTNRTIEISKGKIYDYKFSYSKYIIQRQEEIERQEQAAKNQQKYIEDTQKLIDKFRAKKDKAAFAQTLIRKLDKLDRIEIDDFESSRFRFSFPPAPHSGKVILEGKQLAKNYDSKNIFKSLEFLIPKGQKIALIGKNGIGKSTLLRMITGEETFDGELKLGHGVQRGYYAQNQSDVLDGSKTVFETIDDEATGEIRKNIRSLLGAFLFGGDDIDKKVKVLSGGEKARLALCKLLLQPYNFLLMDEPTNHLDIPSKEMLKQALANYDGTLLVVSHDRDFLHGLTTMVYEIQPDRMRIWPGDVMDFLKEKRAESIAAFEQQKEIKRASINPIRANEKQGSGERDSKMKKIKSTILHLEGRIAKLELQLEKSNQSLLELDYSDQEESEKQFAIRGEIESELSLAMADWEKLQSELDQV